LDVKGFKPFADFSTDATMVSTLPFATSFISRFHFCTKDAATYITSMGLSGNFFCMQNLFLVIHKAQASPATHARAVLQLITNFFGSHAVTKSSMEFGKPS
jgi:hypothetical protein